MPSLVFTDLKVIDFENPEHTGNIGNLYDRNIEHLKACIAEVTNASALGSKPKPIKTIDRSHYGSFSYQIIDHGIYVGNRSGMIMYRMKSLEELRQNHYDWARSALII